MYMWDYIDCLFLQIDVYGRGVGGVNMNHCEYVNYLSIYIISQLPVSWPVIVYNPAIIIADTILSNKYFKL